MDVASVSFRGWSGTSATRRVKRLDISCLWWRKSYLSQYLSLFHRTRVSEMSSNSSTGAHNSALPAPGTHNGTSAPPTAHNGTGNVGPAASAAAAAARAQQEANNVTALKHFAYAMAGVIILFTIFHWSRYFYSRYASKGVRESKIMKAQVSTAR